MSATLDSAVEAEAANSTGPVAMEAWLTYLCSKKGTWGGWGLGRLPRLHGPKRLQSMAKMEHARTKSLESARNS